MIESLGVVLWFGRDSHCSGVFRRSYHAVEINFPSSKRMTVASTKHSDKESLDHSHSDNSDEVVSDKPLQPPPPSTSSSGLIDIPLPTDESITAAGDHGSRYIGPQVCDVNDVSA